MFASKSRDLDRMFFMLLREGEDSAKLIETLCQEACRAGRIKEVMDIAFNQGNTFLLARACWEWVITVTENQQSRTSSKSLVNQVLGNDIDAELSEMFNWVIWLCYWAAIDCQCFILAACASQYQDSFVIAGSPYWLVWHIETDPDFWISSKYKTLLETCLANGYLVPLKKGKFNTYEAGDVLPPGIPAPQMPDIKIKGSCDFCNGSGKNNSTQCQRCLGTGRDDTTVDCPECNGKGSRPYPNLPPVALGPPPMPCGRCNQTGRLLKEGVK